MKPTILLAIFSAALLLGCISSVSPSEKPSSVSNSTNIDISLNTTRLGAYYKLVSSSLTHFSNEGTVTRTVYDPNGNVVKTSTIYVPRSELESIIRTLPDNFFDVDWVKARRHCIGNMLPSEATVRVGSSLKIVAISSCELPELSEFGKSLELCFSNEDCTGRDSTCGANHRCTAAVTYTCAQSCLQKGYSTGKCVDPNVENPGCQAVFGGHSIDSIDCDGRDECCCTTPANQVTHDGFGTYELKRGDTVKAGDYSVVLTSISGNATSGFYLSLMVSKECAQLANDCNAGYYLPVPGTYKSYYIPIRVSAENTTTESAWVKVESDYSIASITP